MDNKIKVKGSPYQQGITQGMKLRPAILRNIKEVQAKLEKDKTDRNRYLQFVRENADYLRHHHQELFDEMRGIGEGSKSIFEDILMLNIPAYFMTGYFRQECSMVLAGGKATADGCTYLIKNRDMSTYIEQAVIEREYPDGLKIIEVNGAGTVTYPAGGMNSRGLAVATTGFWSEKAPADVKMAAHSHIFLNVHLLLAECKTAKEALEYVKKAPRMNGLNMILADREEAWLVEMTKDAIHAEKEKDGILFRTNHYCSGSFCHLNPPEQDYPSTYCRYRRIEEMLRVQYGKIRFQDLFQIMSDHKNGINGLCRHRSDDAPAQTVSTSLFVLEDRSAWTTFGNPCEQLNYSAI